MIIRTVIVGLDESEAAAVCLALEQMRVSPLVFDALGDASILRQVGSFDLAVIGYEADGCGFPLAVRLRAWHEKPVHRPDCIVIADQMCPALTNAARDLGLLAVLKRPVRAKELAIAVEAHLRQRLDRRDISAPKQEEV